MKSILRDLHNGNVIPWERRNPRNEEQLEIVRKIESEERYFMEKMSLDDCKRFQDLSNLHSLLSNMDEDDFFSYSFSLGALLIMDVMKEAETIFEE